MSQHRSLNHGDAELWNKIPGRLCAVENRVEALVASCRECRTHRERWESGMALEFAEFRATVAGALAEIGKQLITGMAKLEKRLDSHKQGSKRA